MSELTREEIEEWRHRLSAFWLSGKTIKESQEKANALCDIALSALTARSEGFREGVEAAAKVCDAYLWAPVCAAAIRSLSPRETDATRCSISFEHPPHDYCDGNPGAKPLSAPSSEVAEMVRRLNSETVEAYRIGNAYIGSLLGQAAALLSKVGQGWERGHVGGGMYLPIPREATEFYIAWTDEAGITWRKNLLPLPPLPERP